MNKGKVVVLNLTVYTRMEIHLIEQRAHVRVFVGNEIGQQGSRGGACYRGHYKLARPDFAGHKECC